MNQFCHLKSPSNENPSITYLYLTEAEGLVEKAEDSSYSHFDKSAYDMLSRLAIRLGLREVRASLTKVSDLELHSGVSAEWRRQVRMAFNADKIRLFDRMDSELNEVDEVGYSVRLQAH